MLFYIFVFFFFNDTATTEIYTLSLHDALPICRWSSPPGQEIAKGAAPKSAFGELVGHPVDEAARHEIERGADRSEEHTSELQSRQYLVCRLLLEKKKN